MEMGGRLRLGKSSYPRKAGIQYAGASRFYHWRSGILDHPRSRVTTVVGGDGCAARTTSRRWRRQIDCFKIEPVAQILALLQNAHQERAVGRARHHRLDQIELGYRDQLQ